MSNTTITPNVGTARLTTNSVLASVAAALTMSGVSPTVLFTASVVAPTGSAILAGGIPVQNLTITAPVASVAATGVAATIGAGSAPVMQTGALSLISIAPALAVGTVTPNSGSVLLGGNVPVIVIPNTSIVPVAGTSRVIGAAPFVAGAASPIAGSLLLSGSLPALSFTLQLIPAGTAALQVHSDAVGMNLSIVVPASNLGVTTTGQSPTVGPSSGVLTLSGNLAKVSGPTVMIVPSGALTLTGLVPGMVYTVPAPPCAALVVGGTVPLLGASYTIAPTPAPLVLTGFAPIANFINTVMRPATVQLALAPTAPALARNLFTFAGSAQLTSNAAIVQVSTLLTPTAGAAALSGNAPTLLPGSSIATTAGSMSINGVAPTTLPAIVTQLGTLTLSSATLSMNLTIAPASVAAVIASTAPGVNGKTTLQTPTGVLTLAAAAPRLNLAITAASAPVNLASNPVSMDLGIVPQSGGSVIASDATAVSQSGLPLTLTGSMLFAASPPIVGLGFAPIVAIVRAQGVQPIVNSLMTLTPSSGAALISSSAPSVNQTGVVVPSVASLAMTGNTVVFQRTGFVAPRAGTLAMNSDVPLVVPTTIGQITPASAALVIKGQPFYIMRYEPDLYYVVNSRGPAQHVVKSPG